MKENNMICQVLIQGMLLLLLHFHNTGAQSITPPIAQGGPDIITYINQPTRFEGYGISPDDFVICEWDFDGNDIFDTVTGGKEIVYYQYERAGIFDAIFKVTSVNNLSVFDKVKVTVKEGTGVQAYYTEPVTASKTDERERSDLVSSAADGITDRYAIMINGGSETRFWDDVSFTYAMLQNKYDFSDESIYLFNYDGVNPSGQNPDNMIDYEAGWDYIQAVFSSLAVTMDEDDELFIWVTDHGNGYAGEDYLYYGYLGSHQAVIDPDDEQDYPESDFKLRSLCTYGDYFCNHGLNEWKVRKYSSEMYRNKFVSHFTDVYFEEYSTTVSDNDVRIERFIDYLAGDFNRNGIIETSLGEVYDFDGDGIQPYDHYTNTFDEDDWGNIDSYIDNFNNINSGTPFNKNYLIFDNGLDGTLDIDLDYDPDNLQVDGTDIDNLGLFDGVDINEDGDMNDYVSIDECISLYMSEDLYDDDLSVWIKSLVANKISVVMQPCFSGGFIGDLSDNNLIIATATTEENVSYDNTFIREFVAAMGWEAFDGSPVDADYNNNGCVSIMEAYEYARINDHQEEINQYDDNGDGIPHEGPLPESGDGYLGAETHLRSCINEAPYVNAGKDTILIFEHSLQLSGTVEDDGLPPDGSLSFYWSAKNGPGTVTFSDFWNLNTFVSFSDTGTYVLSLNAADGQLSASDDITIRVSVIITQQPVSQSICENDPASFNLSVKTKLPLLYQWFFNDAELEDNPNITGSNTGSLHINEATLENEGNFYCRLTYIDTVYTNIAELAINPLPLAPEANDVTVCENATIPPLTAEGENIKWYSDPDLTVLIHEGNSLTTGQSTPGAYVYYATQTENNCSGRASVIKLIINPLPNITLIDDTTIFSNQSLLLEAEDGFINYNWNTDSDSAILEINAEDYDPGTHTFILTVTDSNYCMNSDTVNVTIVEVNLLNEFYYPGISVYPNPTDGIVEIVNPDENINLLNIEIIDVHGKAVISKALTPDLYNNTFEFDLTNYPNGVYLIKMTSKETIRPCYYIILKK